MFLFPCKYHNEFSSVFQCFYKQFWWCFISIYYICHLCFFLAFVKPYREVYRKNTRKLCHPYSMLLHGEKCHRPKMRKKNQQTKKTTKITQESICFIFPNTLLKHLDANNAPEKKQEKKSHK